MSKAIVFVKDYAHARTCSICVEIKITKYMFQRHSRSVFERRLRIQLILGLDVYGIFTAL